MSRLIQTVEDVQKENMPHMKIGNTLKPHACLGQFVDCKLMEQAGDHMVTTIKQQVHATHVLTVIQVTVKAIV